MNHLEALVAEWLAYNGYFTRSTVRVGKRAKGGWEGEIDVVGFHPRDLHFVHVECSTDAWTWDMREEKFRRKFRMGTIHGSEMFPGMALPDKLDQVVVHGYAGRPDGHRFIGGGRLVTSQELAAEIMNGVPANSWKSAIPENFPLMRTLQLSVMAGARTSLPAARLIPKMNEEL